MEKQKFNLIPGMRAIKTFIGVILGMLITYAIGIGDPASVATVVVFTMMKNIEETKNSGINRIKGIVIAGLYTYIILTILKDLVGVTYLSIPYVVSITILLIPLMSLILFTNNHESFALATVVYIGICFGLENYRPFTSALIRIYESTLAVTLCIIINQSKILNKQQFTKKKDQK